MVRPLLIMDFTNKPMETIKEWQQWYNSHQPVAQMNEPLVTKESREVMHETTNAVATIAEANSKAMWIEKAKDHFADTLAEYQYELTGKDFYKAFYQAAYENMGHSQKEYERAKELVDMLRYHHLGQD